jgi:hypothetical protein
VALFLLFYGYSRVAMVMGAVRDNARTRNFCYPRYFVIILRAYMAVAPQIAAEAPLRKAGIVALAVVGNKVGLRLSKYWHQQFAFLGCCLEH